MINNIKEIIKLIEASRWDDAKNIAGDSLGAYHAINALKSLSKNGGMEKEELERIKFLKTHVSNLLKAGWLQEFDVDYFTLLFTYLKRMEKKVI